MLEITRRINLANLSDTLDNECYLDFALISLPDMRKIEDLAQNITIRPQGEKLTKEQVSENAKAYEAQLDIMIGYFRGGQIKDKDGKAARVTKEDEGFKTLCYHLSTQILNTIKPRPRSENFTQPSGASSSTVKPSAPSTPSN